MKSAILALLLSSPSFLFAQSGGYSHRVVDAAGEPVGWATVIVQDADSVVVEAVLSVADGRFSLDKRPADNSIIIIQHLSYQTVVVSGAELMASCAVTITEKENTIEDIVVRGERPLVTIVGNSLSYDAGVLTKDRIVTTAYDVVKELPGVTGSDDELQLVGAGNFTIVINGQITSMSLSQLYALLRSIPAGMVTRINVSYNAPAKYNFNGAVIEVELADNTGYEGTTGELSADYFNQFYSGGRVRGSMNVEKERYSLSVLGNVGRRKTRSGDDMYTRHYFEGDYVDITHDTRKTGKPTAYSIRAAGDYKPVGGGNLNLSYYYSGSTSTGVARAENLFDGVNISRRVASTNEKKSKTHLHNLHFQYNGKLTAGADYTRYNSPDKGLYRDYENSVAETDYRFRNSQKVDKLDMFINKSSAVNDWNLGYGLHFNSAWSDNNSDYLYSVSEGAAVSAVSNTLSSQSEYFANMFFEVSKQITPKLGIKLGVKGEYQYSNIENDGVKRNIWSQWAVYPDASLTYMASEKHMLQLNVTSDKSYPPYWALSANETQYNSYSYIKGNPNLKPSSQYEGQLVYIFNRKYMLMVFASYNKDAVRQMPYQLEARRLTEYEYINFDFSLQYGFALIVPFRIGKFLDSRAVLNGVQIVDRIPDFHGMNIRQSAFLPVVSLNNTVPLYHGKTQKVDLQVDARYQGPAIQGIMDLGEAYMLDAGIRWTISEKLSASVKVDNILRRQTPRPIKIDWARQYSRMEQLDFRTVTVNLTWRFGKYEEKQLQSVDSSRFGKN
ncbi:MAG: TonB-dependent receptor family protein [Rikenellaceae bacterium]|nr:TonB-dependent receptor family protein [Rikenellaceae bacterium]